MKKRKRPMKLSVKLALTIAMLSLLTASAYRDLWIYYEFRQGNTATVTSECISISLDTTNEPRRYSPFYIYSFHLKCGTTVAIYKETAEDLFSSKQAMEQQFGNGCLITFTYVAEPTLVNHVYALVCASENGVMLMETADGISHYSQRLKTIVILDSVIFGTAILVLLVSQLPYLYGKWKHHQNRMTKKRKKSRGMR